MYREGSNDPRFRGDPRPRHRVAARPPIGYASLVTPRESATETRLTRAVRLAGAITYKLAPTTAGIPDRLIIWPTGVVDFVEVKADDGVVSPIQRQRLRELRENRANTFVVFGPAEADAYVRDRLTELGLSSRPVR